MSLYQKASLVQIPSGYKAADAKLYSVVPNSGDGDFTVSSVADATRVNKDGLVETTVANQARLNYDPTNPQDPHLLLEPTRTNNLLRSEEFDNSAWTKFSAGTGTTPVVTANYTTSPDGSNNADRVIFDKGSGTGGSDLSQMRQVVTDVGQGVSSVYIKSNTSESYTMGIDPVGNATLITVTPEWQRFTYSETTNDRLALGLRGSQTSNYADVSVWGAQMEAGSYATSYIPTTTAQVTRTADDWENTDGVSLSGDFTYFVHIKNFEDKTLGNSPLQFFFRQSASPFSYFRFLLEGNERFYAQLRDNNTATTVFNQFSDTLSNLGDNIKLAFAKSGTSCKYYVNGTLVLSSTITDFNYTFNRINHTTGNDQATKLSQVMVFDTGLTDAELITLTT